MFILRIISVLADISVALSGVLFYVMMFSNVANEKKSIKKFKLAQLWLVKFGLISTAVGGLINAGVSITSVINPPVTEVVLNIGLASLFIWASMYHLNRFAVVKVNWFNPPKSSRKKHESIHSNIQRQ